MYLKFKKIPPLLCRNQLQSSSFRLEIPIRSFKFLPIHLSTRMDWAFGRHAPWSSLATWWLAALTSVCWCVPRPVMMLKRTLGPVMFRWIPWCDAWKVWIVRQHKKVAKPAEADTFDFKGQKRWHYKDINLPKVRRRKNSADDQESWYLIPPSNFLQDFHQVPFPQHLFLFGRTST